VDVLPPIAYSRSMAFKTLSPICILERQAVGQNKYLLPSDEDAKRLILYSLQEKYQIYYGKPYEGDTSDYDFRVLDMPRAKLITLKADTPTEQKVKAYLCRFRITLPEDLMMLLTETGIGNKGSIGFGMVTA
jgi:CRISPR-associated endoribonuclease Cas6